MVLTIEEIAEKINPVIEQHDVSKVWLFGSYARGDADENSDIDRVVDSLRIKDYDELFDLQ